MQINKYNCDELLTAIRNNNDSIYAYDKLFVYDNWIFEKYRDYNTDEICYRTVFCEDDYDYVEEADLIAQLHIVSVHIQI